MQHNQPFHIGRYLVWFMGMDNFRIFGLTEFDQDKDKIDGPAYKKNKDKTVDQIHQGIIITAFYGG